MNREALRAKYIGRKYSQVLAEELHANPESRGNTIRESVAILVIRDGKIKDLTVNDKDLILDNFGIWLNGFIRAVGNGNSTFNLNDTGGVARTFNAYNTSNLPTEGTSTYGCMIQLGDDDTAPARTDVNITSPLGTSPESGMFNITTGSYAGGAISLCGCVTAGGAGTVKEVGLFAIWKDSAGTARTIMLFHDLTGDIGYVAGDMLLASYRIAL